MNHITTKCIVIVGLPGSGKTTLAYQLAKEIVTAVVIDDTKTKKEIESLLSEETVILTSPLFCKKKSQDRLAEDLQSLGITQVEWIFFENEPSQCKKNASRREEKNVTQSINYLSKCYHIPEGVVTRPVFKGQN